MLKDIKVFDHLINNFMRHTDHMFLYEVIKKDYERGIILNTRHNLITLVYFTGVVDGAWNYEQTGMKSYRVTHEVLDLLFEKYKGDKSILIKLFKFCLSSSKSKSYWSKLKDAEYAQEAMAMILGNNNEDG